MVIKRIVLEGAILQYTVFVAKIEIAEVHSANDIEAHEKSEIPQIVQQDGISLCAS